MELIVLGSGGCTVIPKPLCPCRICQEARDKGPPYERTGPAVFLGDEQLLIDTPAEIARQLNREGIEAVRSLLLTHLDPDHVEGLRVVEQIALDFRTWRAYPEKRIRLLLPEWLTEPFQRIHTAHGPLAGYYEQQGFLECVAFGNRTTVGQLDITALPVDRGEQIATIYVLEKAGRKLVYAPCDIKPFPEERSEVHGPDLLVIQPGIFERGLKHGFVYPEDHVSRTTLYTFEETVALSRRIQAKQVLFVHLEEYWNRGHDDYLALGKTLRNMRFAHDGLRLTI